MYGGLILLDAAGPILFVAFGLLAVAAAYVLVVIVETVVLLAMRWAGVGRTLADVLLMNLVSTAIGFAILMWVGFGGVFGSDQQLLPLVALAVAFAASVVTEAVFLAFLRRQSTARAWQASAVANTTSYVAMTATVFVLGRVTS